MKGDQDNVIEEFLQATDFQKITILAISYYTVSLKYSLAICVDWNVTAVQNINLKYKQECFFNDFDLKAIQKIGWTMHWIKLANKTEIIFWVAIYKNVLKKKTI